MQGERRDRGASLTSVKTIWAATAAAWLPSMETQEGQPGHVAERVGGGQARAMEGVIDDKDPGQSRDFLLLHMINNNDNKKQ